MFVRYFIELDLPAALAEEALLGSPEDWIPGIAVGAQARGERLLTEVGFGEGKRIERLVVVDVSPPIRVETKVILPLTWRPASDSGLFPALEGDVELAALGPARSQLSMTARYTPPFGLLGRVADRALLHRVAEATVKDFVDRVGEAMRGRLAHQPVA
jgi:hypothetical protein